MSKVNNTFKINLDSDDMLITGEQRIKFLTLHNKLKETIQYIEECKDLRLSDVAMLEELIHTLHSSLKFVPQKNKEGDGAMWYADYVLRSDELAWVSPHEYEE